MFLFFDLDGTITDSRHGIVRCIAHSIQRAGLVPPPPDELTRYVGPPLAASFATLLGTSSPETIEQAIIAYRERYERLGMFENALYPGIGEAVTSLDAAGHTLSLVTAKPHVYAHRILAHFKLDRAFRGVYGPELGDRHYTKEGLIRTALAREGATLANTVMVGDRAEDIRGAKENGLRAVAVTWGYGGQAELLEAHPDSMVASSAELLDVINRWSAAA